MLALGGGAVDDRRRARARCASAPSRSSLDVDVDTAWERVRGSDRPLAQDEARVPAALRGAAAALPRGRRRGRARDVDGVVLAAGGVHVEPGALDRLGELVPGRRPGRARRRRRTCWGSTARGAQEALGTRLASTHELPPGEEAKQLAVVERLWSELALDRGGTVVALGGGCTTDVAGFAAATYLRGVPWVAVPTTLVGQVDAAIGGKTAIDIPQGKNLVGAFHWPARVVIDETLLETLPERERRQGLAELVKTGLLAGAPSSTSRGARRVQGRASACATRTTAARGAGSTSATRSRTRSRPRPASTCRTARRSRSACSPRCGSRAATRPTSSASSRRSRSRVDRERAWQALLRDKKRSGGAINLVLLGDDGPFVEARPAAEVRARSMRLIA